MSEPLTLKCSACRRTFTGDVAFLRATIWPHAKTHKRKMAFGSEFILSCNCGECEFCRNRAALSARKDAGA